MSKNYVSERENFLYYKYIRSLLTLLSVNCNSIIDIGSNQIDVISHLNCRKYSLDINNPLEKDDIITIKSDFLKFNPPEKFDIATCFQVLEHIENVDIFAQKLLYIAKIIVVTVPYKWEKGACKWHIHDPIDENKLISWFKIKPVFIDIFDSRLFAIFINDIILYNKLHKINKEDFLSYFKFYLEQRKESKNLYKTIKDLNIKLNFIEKEYALLKSKSYCNFEEYSDPQLLLNKAKATSLNNFNKAEKLFNIGIQLYPFFLDFYGHPAFIKEYFRVLVEKKLFRQGLKLIIDKKYISLQIVNSKWYIIILARAYEKHKLYRRALSLFSLLKNNQEAQVAIERLKRTDRQGDSL